MKLNNHDIEFIEESHTYLVDGVIVPSVTTIISNFYKPKIQASKKKLEIASRLGTRMHLEIEMYEKYGIESDSKEFKNYIFLKKLHNFENIDNEKMVLYEKNGKVLYIGRFDQLIKKDGKIGINDFKRVSNFEKDKVSMQLTLYALAYEQCYNKKIDFVSGTHLKEEKRKFYILERKDKKALNLVKKYYKEKEE